MCASIREFGFKIPCLVRSDGEIVDGHLRLKAARKLGIPEIPVILWGFGRYKFQHQPIFYAHVADQKDPWYGDKSQSTLWEEKKPAANRIHPTAKPVELVERALLNSSKAGDIVVDLFGGSGSTLIGRERRERKARLMEIAPSRPGVGTN